MNDWHVQINGYGRAGSIMYFENGSAAPFYWELGGGDVVVVITGPRPQDWDNQLPWAVGRREELLSRVAREVIRSRAPLCSFELADGGVTAVIRSGNDLEVPPR
jgi:hypothetical protein